MGKNKNNSLSWEAFQALGNPENVENNTDKESVKDDSGLYSQYTVRIWLDKKHRRGKKATIIKGIEIDEIKLKSLCKELKAMCGVGGSAKEGEIIIQGDQRQRVLKVLHEKGYTNTKIAGG